jgi:hypothetical protein
MDEFAGELLIHLLPEAGDVDVNHVIEWGSAGGFFPHVVAEHLPRHQLVVVAQQVFEELELAGRQLQYPVATGDRARHQIHLKVPGFQAQNLIHPAPSEQRPNPG